MTMTSDEQTLQLRSVRARLSDRLNDWLCDMKPGYDDSIVGFNEAWDVMRKFFDDELKRIERIAEAETLESVK